VGGEMSSGARAILTAALELAPEERASLAARLCESLGRAVAETRDQLRFEWSARQGSEKAGAPPNDGLTLEA